MTAMGRLKWRLLLLRQRQNVSLLRAEAEADDCAFAAAYLDDVSDMLGRFEDRLNREKISSGVNSPALLGAERKGTTKGLVL